MRRNGLVVYAAMQRDVRQVSKFTARATSVSRVLMSAEKADGTCTTWTSVVLWGFSSKEFKLFLGFLNFWFISRFLDESPRTGVLMPKQISVQQKILQSIWLGGDGPS